MIPHESTREENVELSSRYSHIVYTGTVSTTEGAHRLRRLHCTDEAINVMRRTAVVRGRGGKKCLVMICEAGSELGKRCSWRSRTKTTAMINSRWLGARNCAPGRALRTSTAKPTACTAGCELVLHYGNFGMDWGKTQKLFGIAMCIIPRAKHVGW